MKRMTFWNKKNRIQKYKEEVAESISRFENEVGESNYPEIKLFKEQFPSEFIRLFDIAQKYGQSCDELRWYYINKSTEDELNEIISQVAAQEKELVNWTQKTLMNSNEETALFFTLTAYMDTKGHLKRLKEI